MKTGWGEAIRFMEMAMDAETDECIIWPFTMTSAGYPNLGGKIGAHVAVCARAHGSRPGSLQAAHSCGERLCINKRHLSWKTPVGNEADKIEHGTVSRGADRWNAKLTETDVVDIRNRYRAGETQTAIAADYGITQSAISNLLTGKRWKWVE